MTAATIASAIMQPNTTPAIPPPERVDDEPPLSCPSAGLTGGFVGFDAPARQILSFGHEMHVEESVAPVFGLYVPSEHNVGALRPELGQYDPFGHCLHEAVPLSSLYWPSLHNMNDVMPLDGQ